MQKSPQTSRTAAMGAFLLLYPGHGGNRFAQQENSRRLPPAAPACLPHAGVLLCGTAGVLFLPLGKWHRRKGEFPLSAGMLFAGRLLKWHFFFGKAGFYAASISVTTQSSSPSVPV